MGVPVELRPSPGLSIHQMRGDAIALPLRIRLDGVPQDVTGKSFAAQMRTAVDAGSPVDFVIDTTNAATGLIVLRIADTTAFLLNTTYVWDCENTTDKQTVARGTWAFDGDVRHP